MVRPASARKRLELEVGPFDLTYVQLHPDLLFPSNLVQPALICQNESTKLWQGC